MSEPETFFARWSRLKSETASEEGGVDQKRAAEASTRAEASPRAETSPPDFDPAGLPPIESIGPDSDIRSFLQAGVPAELARAALRSTWIADPSIRDFIGIAESQWDFNDPAAIPGFGSLEAGDCARVAEVLARLHDGTAEVSESPAAIAEPASTTPDPEGCGPIAAAQIDPAPAESSHDADLEPRAAETRTRRSHGGALPR